MTVHFENAEYERQDVWACVQPAVQEFIVNDGSPYGRGNAMDYTYGDKRMPGLEITIRVWRATDGIYAKRVAP